MEGKIDDLKARVGEMEAKVDGKFQGLDIGLEEVATSLKQNIEQAVETLNQKIESIGPVLQSPSTVDGGHHPSTAAGLQVNKSTTSNFSATVVSQVANELREREKRVLNVVFSGEVDKEKVDRFLEASNTEKPSKVLEIKTQQSEKTLYIVTMVSERDKWALIAKGKSISQSKSGLDNIFVNPDLTKTERDVQYELRQEVRNRRQKGENVKISKGRVVVISGS